MILLKKIMTNSKFNFTLTDFSKEMDPNLFFETVFKLLQEILNERHVSIQKKQVLIKESRLNFACPYCGDSAKDANKKRGNIYTDSWGYHCYNCNVHTNIERFLSDFGKSLNASETVYARNVHSEAVSKFAHKDKNIDITYFIKPELLEQYAIPKEHIFKHYKLKTIQNGGRWIQNYLKQRHQTNYDVFGWDSDLMRLFIFNLTKEGNVIGFQVRNFKTEPKYVTHTLEMIYKKFDIALPTSDGFKEVNRLSFLFGIATTDFSQMITITEGPLDSFLIKNCMSTCGLDNDFPFEISNIRWMYDYDKDGTAKALEQIGRGESVFLWKKYIADIGINIYKKKLDYTDVITIAKKSNLPLKPIGNYFSSSKYDAFYI